MSFPQNIYQPADYANNSDRRDNETETPRDIRAIITERHSIPGSLAEL
jgi:hypothetical protein